MLGQSRCAWHEARERPEAFRFQLSASRSQYLPRGVTVGIKRDSTCKVSWRGLAPSDQYQLVAIVNNITVIICGREELCREGITVREGRLEG